MKLRLRGVSPRRDQKPCNCKAFPPLWKDRLAARRSSRRKISGVRASSGPELEKITRRSAQGRRGWVVTRTRFGSRRSTEPEPCLINCRNEPFKEERERGLQFLGMKPLGRDTHQPLRAQMGPFDGGCLPGNPLEFRCAALIKHARDS